MISHDWDMKRIFPHSIEARDLQQNVLKIFPEGNILETQTAVKYKELIKDCLNVHKMAKLYDSVMWLKQVYNKVVKAAIFFYCKWCMDGLF